MRIDDNMKKYEISTRDHNGNMQTFKFQYAGGYDIKVNIFENGKDGGGSAFYINNRIDLSKQEQKFFNRCKDYAKEYLDFIK